MSQTDTSKPAAALAASMFQHMADLGPDALSSFVGILVEHGDLGYLKIGLDSGALDEMSIKDAAKHCGTVLLHYGWRANSSDPTDTGAVEMEVAEAWLRRRINDTGDESFAGSVLMGLVNETGESNFVTIARMVAEPGLGLDLSAEVSLPAGDAEMDGRPDVQYSLLGKLAKEYPDFALERLQPTVERFPDTVALPPEKPGKPWLALNLAEQIVCLNAANGKQIARLADMALPGSPARQQLGELALTLLVNQDDEFLRQSCDANQLLTEKTHRLSDERGGTNAFGITLIGDGAEFPDPAFAWGYIRSAETYVATSNALESSDVRGVISLPHLALHLHPDVCAPEVGARALSRMIVEGGVSVEVQDSKARTLLQAAASLGQREAVETLLDLGADPKHASGPRKKLTAAEMADKNGHLVIAKLIRAHEAQGAIAAVLARHKPGFNQPL